MAGNPDRPIVRCLCIKVCYLVSQGCHNFMVCAKAKLHLLNQLAQVAVVAGDWRAGVNHGRSVFWVELTYARLDRSVPMRFRR